MSEEFSSICRPIRIGVLGAANIATRSIIPALLDLPHLFECVGVASKSLERRAALQSDAPFKIYDDYDALLKVGLDAVYVPLPNKLHYSWISEALSAGMHCLVEKPLACSLAETSDLTRMAKLKDLALFENFQFRFHPQLKLIRDLISHEDFGEIRLVQSSFGFPPFEDRNNIRYDSALGGGALLDAAPYCVKVTSELLGKGVHVDCASLGSAKGFDVDLWGDASLRHRQRGVTSQISFGFDNAYRCELRVWGSKADLSAQRIFTAPADYDGFISYRTKNEESRIPVPRCNHFLTMLEHFAKLCRDSKLRSEEHDMNLCQALLLEDIREQAAHCGH